jgi:hypothetical protein
LRKSSGKKRNKIKGSVGLVNDHIWNRRISPKDYTLSISGDSFVFTKDLVNVNAVDQMINTISKSRTPSKIVLNHTNLILHECVDWLIKYCDTFGLLFPQYETEDQEVYDRVERYKKYQKNKNRGRKKKNYV